MSHPEKIVELIKGIGASPDLANAVAQELESYTKAVKERYEVEYQNKIERAKQVCVEEVNAEKVRLAGRVKTFLESKATSMETAGARQRAIEESESAAILKKTKALLEGIELKESGATSQELLASQKKAARLEKMCQTLKEERVTLISKANTANDIAAKALQRNRQLEEQTKLTEGYCKEHKLPFPGGGKCAKCGGSKDAKAGVKADVKGDEKKVDEGKKPESARLDESRKIAAASMSTRRTMVESQARPVAKSAVPAGDDITQIADTIE